ncbi:hypothetical protein F0562_010145 [Nyssa sinensis]|uniref:Uncharacterized protein n=1 Tax=Nyssa sinensis TaxID=561372 RepID=A0A5J5A1R5_9ASTE|nr:hypothetical protein F0562_010145 [Nyssa sinensis]
MAIVLASFRTRLLGFGIARDASCTLKATPWPCPQSLASPHPATLPASVSASLPPLPPRIGTAPPFSASGRSILAGASASAGSTSAPRMDFPAISTLRSGEAAVVAFRSARGSSGNPLGPFFFYLSRHFLISRTSSARTYPTSGFVVHGLETLIFGSGLSIQAKC